MDIARMGAETAIQYVFTGRVGQCIAKIIDNLATGANRGGINPTLIGIKNTDKGVIGTQNGG